MDEFGNFFLQLNMKIERSVQEAAACTSRTILVESGLCLIDDTLIAGQARIGIRTEHEHFVSSHLNFGVLFACDFTEIGIYTGLHKLLGFTIALVLFL